MSNCRVKFSAKSLISNGHNHDFPEKLNFGETSNIVTQVKLSWLAKTTSLEKIALKLSKLNNKTSWNMVHTEFKCISLIGPTYHFQRELLTITVFITVFFSDIYPWLFKTMLKTSLIENPLLWPFEVMRLAKKLIRQFDTKFIQLCGHQF